MCVRDLCLPHRRRLALLLQHHLVQLAEMRAGVTVLTSWRLASRDHSSRVPCWRRWQMRHVLTLQQTIH